MSVAQRRLSPAWAGWMSSRPYSLDESSKEENKKADLKDETNESLPGSLEASQGKGVSIEFNNSLEEVDSHQ
eukprot:scaffold55459_cov55-Attheya_sp.AAC.5